MRTALLVIATGEKYHAYVNSLLESAKTYFVEHDAIVWTDTLAAAGTFDAKFVLTKNALGYPLETLHRYYTILQQDWLIQKYDQVFYCDADMRFVGPVGEEIFSDGITATLHPGYVGTRGTPDINPKSHACCLNNTAYYCGGFNGGRSTAYLDMAVNLMWNIELDSQRGVMAVWHDESHLNRYLTDHPPAKVLDPSYCYPEDAGSHYTDKWKAAGLSVTPKLLALTKAGR